MARNNGAAGTGGNESTKTGAANRAACAGASEDMSRWTSADDVASVTAVLQVLLKHNFPSLFPISVERSTQSSRGPQILNAVYNRRNLISLVRTAIRSDYFKVGWIWKLFSKHELRISVDNMRALSRDMIRNIQSRTWFTKREEALLAMIPSVSRNFVIGFFIDFFSGKCSQAGAYVDCVRRVVCQAPGRLSRSAHVTFTIHALATHETLLSFERTQDESVSAHAVRFEFCRCDQFLFFAPFYIFF